MLILLAIAGAYLYGSTTKTLQNTVEVSSGNNKVETVRFIKSAGYPFEYRKKLTFSLGIPISVQAVQITSDHHNRGAEQIFTDKFNDEMGRWVLGYPDNATPQDNEVSVLAISNSWINSAQDNDYSYPEPGADLSTPLKKKQYIANLKERSLECVKDSKKGFQTKDKVFSVCYKVTPGRESFSPHMSLEGYGEIEDKPFIFVGYIDMSDSKAYDHATHMKLLEEAKAGKLPQSINDIMHKFINAFSQTSVSIENAP